MATIQSSSDTVQGHVSALRIEGAVASACSTSGDNTPVAANTVTSYSAISKCMNEIKTSLYKDVVGISHAAGQMDDADANAALLLFNGGGTSL